MTHPSPAPRARALSGALAPVLALALAAPLTAALTLSHASPASADPLRVLNPYAGAQVYVDPLWSANAAAEPGGQAVADQPTAVWLDRVDAIAGGPGGMGLRDHLDTAVGQGADLIQLTLYNLPGRDCDRLAGGGEFTLDELDRYQDEFIDPIVEILAEPAYAALRIVAVVEPNSLPNLVTHTTPRDTATFACDQALVSGVYQAGIGYALAQLGTVPHVYAYLDLSHHGQLGWPDNAGPATQLLVQAATSSGSTLDQVHGFVLNTANYSVLHEEFFDLGDVVNGEPVAQTSWVDWNHAIDEVPYLVQSRHRLVTAGFSPDISMIIDTSRNGWGGTDRPTGPGPQTTAEEYVEASRIDRRHRITNWCNQAGSGLGERPAAAPEPGVDAYVWIKPPGESDGASDPRTSRLYEPMCDPRHSQATGSYRPTGALPGAPPAGEWFPAHFQELLANAWPPLP